MYACTHRRSLASLLAHLPFDLDDERQACGAFVQWQRTQQQEDLKIVLVWSYAFVYRYFLGKVAATGHGETVELDAAIGQAQSKIQRRLHTVDNAALFVRWVRVVCHRTFIDIMRGRKPMEHLNRDLPVPMPHLMSEHDYAALLDVLRQAIAALPAFLQEVATLRFVMDQSYEAIAETTGLGIATTRAYVFKARRKLSKDPLLEPYRHHGED